VSDAGHVNVRGIADGLGSPNHLKADLTALSRRRYLRVVHIRKEHIYSLGKRGIKYVATHEAKDLSASFDRLKKMDLSGMSRPELEELAKALKGGLESIERFSGWQFLGKAPNGGSKLGGPAAEGFLQRTRRPHTFQAKVGGNVVAEDKTLSGAQQKALAAGYKQEEIALGSRPVVPIPVEETIVDGILQSPIVHMIGTPEQVSKVDDLIRQRDSMEDEAEKWSTLVKQAMLPQARYRPGWRLSIELWSDKTGRVLQRKYYGLAPKEQGGREPFGERLPAAIGQSNRKNA